MPDITHKSSGSRRSQASVKATMKRSSVKKDSETLTLMPVDQSVIDHRRISGTIVMDNQDDGEMVCFSPSNMEVPVALQGMKSASRGGAATQSIDRTTQHMRIT
jgi:hypothetical protein